MDISRQILTTAIVLLILTDVLGTEVATIVDQMMQPGEYTRAWDAGRGASGVYYYRLTAGSSSVARKMVLVK